MYYKVIYTDGTENDFDNKCNEIRFGEKEGFISFYDMKMEIVDDVDPLFRGVSHYVHILLSYVNKDSIKEIVCIN